MDTIGKRIRYARKSKNLTLTDIKKITGLSTGNLSELENDKFLPSANALIQFRRIYDVSIDWILTGEESLSNEDAKVINEMKEKYLCNEYNEDEKELIKLYRKLDSTNKQNLWGYLRVATSSNNYK